MTPSKSYVEALVAKWQDALQLTTWEINVDIKTDPFTDDPDVKASTETLYQYFRADIDIYPPFWTVSAERQEKIIIHELYHLLVAQLSDMVNREFVTKKNLEDVTEQTTELLSRGAWAIAHTQNLWSKS